MEEVSLQYLCGQMEQVLDRLAGIKQDQAALKQDQATQWKEQHDANGEIHRRMDLFINQKYVTLSECESRCRGRVADRQWFIYIAIVAITETLNFIGAHWQNIINVIHAGTGGR